MPEEGKGDWEENLKYEKAIMKEENVQRRFLIDQVSFMCRNKMTFLHIFDNTRNTIPSLIFQMTYT